MAGKGEVIQELNNLIKEKSPSPRINIIMRKVMESTKDVNYHVVHLGSTAAIHQPTTD